MHGARGVAPRLRHRQDAVALALRRFGRGCVAQLPLDAAKGAFGIGNARRVPRCLAPGTAFEHRKRREKPAACPLRAVQRLVGEAEIVQIVGDERVGRAEPQLIDRGRLLQRRQRVLGPAPAQIQIAHLRQAARGLRRFRRRAGAGRARAPPRGPAGRRRNAPARRARRRTRAAVPPKQAGCRALRIRPRGRPRRAPRRHRRGPAQPAPARRK